MFSSEPSAVQVSQIRAEEDFVNDELARPCKHFLRRAVGVGLGEGRALRPSDEILERAPPSLDLVVSSLVGIVDEPTRLMAELHGARTMHLVSYESRSLIDQMNPPLEAIFEID